MEWFLNWLGENWYWVGMAGVAVAIVVVVVIRQIIKF